MKNNFFDTAIPKQFIPAIEQIIDMSIKKAVAIPELNIKEYFKFTEKRLYAYMTLLENIKRYEKDKEDLEKESHCYGSQKSKDIVRMQMSGVRLSPEEILHGRILNLERKKQIDVTEIQEIQRALDVIKNDKYYMIIELKYFEKYNDTQIAQEMHCDESTVKRRKNKLVREMMLSLYGAVVLGG
jgi:DNA-directed RNA polymerase specialized sigma24 family protein